MSIFYTLYMYVSMQSLHWRPYIIIILSIWFTCWIQATKMTIIQLSELIFHFNWWPTQNRVHTQSANYMYFFHIENKNSRPSNEGFFSYVSTSKNDILYDLWYFLQNAWFKLSYGNSQICPRNCTLLFFCISSKFKDLHSSLGSLRHGD